MKIIVDENSAAGLLSPGERLTTGTKGKLCNVELHGAAWDGLLLAAICKGSGESITQTFSGNSFEVPWECFTKANTKLSIGITGYIANADGTKTFVITTNYALFGVEEKGAVTSDGTNGTDPTLEVWEQIQSSLAAETAERKSSDTAEAEARAEAITAEETRAKTAENTKVDVSTFNEKLSALEIAIESYADSITAEETARANGDTAEANARTAAISAEASSRSEADALLQKAIDDEVTARTDSVSTEQIRAEREEALLSNAVNILSTKVSELENYKEDIDERTESAISEISEKAEEVIESIPEDYTALTEEVDAVKEDLSDLSENVSDLNQEIYGSSSEAVSPSEFEDGSINSGNGTNVNPDKICIRTSTAKTYTDTVIVTNANTSLYRVKYYVYLASDGSFVKADSTWHTESSFEFVPDDTYIYRFQIATRTGASIVLSDAVASVAFTYKNVSKGMEEKVSDLEEKVSDLEENNASVSGKYLHVSSLNTAKTSDTIPDYWMDYLDERITTIRDALRDGANKICFMMVADTHYYGRDLHNINGAILKYVASKTNCTRMLHLGDVNSENGTPKTAIDFMQEPMRIMRSAFNDVLIVRGNHDDNQEGSRGWNDSRITKSDSYSYMFRGIKAIFGDTKTYFYQDDVAEKVRYIALDNTDISYDSESTWQKMLAFGKNQLQWLCDTLKDTPSGYSIVIMIHSMLAPSVVTIEHPSEAVQTRASNYLAVCDILKAFKNRSALSLSLDGSFSTYNSAYYSGTITSDFSECDADIVAVFSGHEHIDCIEDILGSDGNSIGIKNTCTQNSSSMFPTTIISYPYQNQMTLGTTTEYIYDFVVIDTSGKKVDMYRIGAGADRTFNY